MESHSNFNIQLGHSRDQFSFSMLNGMFHQTIGFKEEANQSYNHILPAQIKNDATKIALPRAYLIVSAAQMYLEWVNGERNSGTEDKYPEIKQRDDFFPLLKLRVEYNDIGNNTHNKSFSLQPKCIKGRGFPGSSPYNTTFRAFIELKIEEDNSYK